MSEFNVILAERKGLGQIKLCECKSVYLSLGPVTVCLAAEAFAQAALMIREAMEQLAEMTAAGQFEEAVETGPKMQSQLMH